MKEKKGNPVQNLHINYLAVARATGQSGAGDGIDDLEAVGIWGIDHYSIGPGNHPQVTENVAENVTIQRPCYCVHNRCSKCGRWQLCTGVRTCHWCEG